MSRKVRRNGLGMIMVMAFAWGLEIGRSWAEGPDQFHEDESGKWHHDLGRVAMFSQENRLEHFTQVRILFGNNMLISISCLSLHAQHSPRTFQTFDNGIVRIAPAS